MPDWADAGDYSGGGESGQAQDRTYTATVGGKSKTFADYNEAARWVTENRRPGEQAEVRTT